MVTIQLEEVRRKAYADWNGLRRASTGGRPRFDHRGEKIEYEYGLLGHSDADVLLHAIMDALLGAAALGDIGTHFPDTDERYRGISSVRLLAYVDQLLEENGYSVGNIDATIIAQRPKMAPHISKMRENIANTLGLELNQVNIKATTEEGQGFTGSGDGISAQAVCILE